MIDDGYCPAESKRFKGRYRIPSTRLRGWDYAKCGWYFVTICTRGKCPWFGEIVDERMRLSDIGRIVNECWHRIPKRHPHVTLDTFVIMPNHVHGIVVIYRAPTVVETPRSGVPSNHVETPRGASLQGQNVIQNVRTIIHEITTRHTMHKPQWKS